MEATDIDDVDSMNLFPDHPELGTGLMKAAGVGSCPLARTQRMQTTASVSTRLGEFKRPLTPPRKERNSGSPSTTSPSGYWVNIAPNNETFVRIVNNRVVASAPQSPPRLPGQLPRPRESGASLGDVSQRASGPRQAPPAPRVTTVDATRHAAASFASPVATPSVSQTWIPSRPSPSDSPLQTTSRSISRERTPSHSPTQSQSPSNSRVHSPPPSSWGAQIPLRSSSTARKPPSISVDELAAATSPLPAARSRGGARTTASSEPRGLNASQSPSETPATTAAMTLLTEGRVETSTAAVQAGRDAVLVSVLQEHWRLAATSTGQQGERKKTAADASGRGLQNPAVASPSWLPASIPPSAAVKSAQNGRGKATTTATAAITTLVVAAATITTTAAKSDSFVSIINSSRVVCAGDQPPRRGQRRPSASVKKEFDPKQVESADHVHPVPLPAAYEDVIQQETLTSVRSISQQTDREAAVQADSSSALQDAARAARGIPLQTSSVVTQTEIVALGGMGRRRGRKRKRKTQFKLYDV